MGRTPHAHWDLRSIPPVLVPIHALQNTLEVYLVKSSSTGDTISKGLDGTYAEPMVSRGPEVTGTVK